MAINPDDHEALYNKGLVLAELGRYEEAIAVYDVALAINPDCQLAINNKQTALEALSSQGHEANANAFWKSLAVGGNRCVAPKIDHAYSIDGLLHQAQVAINNALNHEQILTTLSDFGYTADRIQQGKALYAAALNAQATQQRKAGAQRSATAELEANRAVANATYMRLLKIARVAFRGDVGIATQLSLNGQRKRPLAGWLAQANQFYTNALANAAVLEGFSAFGITADKLQAGLAQVQAVAASNLSQEREKGEAKPPPRPATPLWMPCKAGSATIWPLPKSPWKTIGSC
ncbi:putative TPR repeat domain protein [Halomicronema hongdechloris C2206]|uniref:TPR repeat domain protein n=1 Tax=Halomicronema hongdechloris C2206 TaxID=1641165 RepID=A0A1Z3HSY2_9CYAN|nr:putative TPR repeat domain protein [Halomicronema hongdechloris C2206]